MAPSREPAPACRSFRCGSSPVKAYSSRAAARSSAGAVSECDRDPFLDAGVSSTELEGERVTSRAPSVLYVAGLRLGSGHAQ